MASSIGSKIPQLIVGAATISALGLSTIASIRTSNTSDALQRAIIGTGDRYVVTSEDSTPQTYYNDDPTPIITDPTLPGTEHCTGNTGAVLCTVTIKLTGSGGHRNNNAGSFLCSTTTCSIVDSRVFTEAVPRADKLYGGWTTTPGSASGSQLFNNYAASSGATIIGSGTYLGIGANGVNIEKDVPPGATIKFTWSLGNGSEDYKSYIATAVIRYWKYYRP